MRIAIHGFVGLGLHLLILVVPLMTIRQTTMVFKDPSVVLFLVLATAFYLADITSLLYRRDDENPSGCRAQAKTHRLALMTGLVILGIFWVALWEHAIRAPVRFGDLWTVAGALLMAGGVLLRFLAIRTLQRFFVTELTVTPDQPLIQVGVYRFVRHPSETGNLGIALGTSVLLASPTAFAVWLAVFLPLVLRRVREEDRFLESVLSDAFDSYAERVKRLVPFVY